MNVKLYVDLIDLILTSVQNFGPNLCRHERIFKPFGAYVRLEMLRESLAITVVLCGREPLFYISKR